MARKPRTTPGLVTNVSPTLRIVNGDIDSLKKMRGRGRPKSYETLFPVVPGVPEYPQFQDLPDDGEKGVNGNGFYVIRSNASKQERKKQNKSLQQRFDELASEVVKTERWDSVTKTVISPWGTEFSTARIEKSVPGSFCTCKINKRQDYDSPCLIHGVKLDGCGCGGIEGTWGYRVCAGHRSNGHVPGYSGELTEKTLEILKRMKEG